MLVLVLLFHITNHHIFLVEDKLNYILDKSLPTIACDAKDNFIVNFYSEEHNGRTFKIFNYQGVLQYTGPMVNGMQGEMAWKLPSSVIFVVVSKKDCKEIQAYEKIGAFREKFQILDDVSYFNFTNPAFKISAVFKINAVLKINVSPKIL